MIRFDDWPTRLWEFLEERETKPFVWGENDCGLFASDAILAMTGTDLAHEFRGRYKTSKKAMRLVKEKGGIEGLAGVADAVTQEFKMREIPVSFAQRGDLVLLDHEGREALGIVNLENTTIIATGEEQLVKLPLSSAKRAWRV